MASARTLFLCVINAFLAVCGSVVNILVTVVILEHRELQKGPEFVDSVFNICELNRLPDCSTILRVLLN